MGERVRYLADRLGERGMVALYWVVLSASVAALVAVHATIGF